MQYTDITADATYRVTIYSGLSSKRWKDAVKLVRGIGDYTDTTSEFDPASKTWLVTLPDGSSRGLGDLQSAVVHYHCEVERIEAEA